MVLLDEQGGRIHATVKDVIVLISGIGKVCDRVISGRKTKMVVLELDDLRGHKLECTLWEHYVDEVQSFLADNDDPHNVLIVQLGRIKCFRCKVGITNTKYTTRIVMDSKLNEIVEFKKRLSIDGVESSTRMTQLSTQSSYSFENDFLKEIEKSLSVTTCITYGTIKAIESKYNWWYKSCKKCPFSVYEDFEKWYCKNCQKHWEDYYPRFSVQVRVVDNTDSASFILFDRDCVSLLGMSAAELRELHFKRGADLDQFPNELNVLNDMQIANDALVQSPVVPKYFVFFAHAILTEESIKNITLEEIDKVLQSNGKCLSDYPSMPRINSETLLDMQNRLVLDELMYDRFALEEEHKRLINSLTDEQKTVYDKIISAVTAGNRGLFFLYGFGGTGKTFIWNTLSASIRSKAGIVLNVASSGIASLLLPGG
ncbi:uncharacterized protein LOC133285308 [Gastrolobium bilobum]|uniref:uncharacterized protein LOC133285308 n=1 Tax=Gastrolobium bilobum TaxID=150636 RepID=UPI002AB14A83|nr:uncharacterized protein LOC133285308 [Gastrolobium bilobum]